MQILARWAPLQTYFFGPLLKFHAEIQRLLFQTFLFFVFSNFIRKQCALLSFKDFMGVLAEGNAQFVNQGFICNFSFEYSNLYCNLFILDLHSSSRPDKFAGLFLKFQKC